MVSWFSDWPATRNRTSGALASSVIRTDPKYVRFVSAPWMTRPLFDPTYSRVGPPGAGAAVVAPGAAVAADVTTPPSTDVVRLIFGTTPT